MKKYTKPTKTGGKKKKATAGKKSKDAFVKEFSKKNPKDY